MALGTSSHDICWFIRRTNLFSQAWCHRDVCHAPIDESLHAFYFPTSISCKHFLDDMGHVECWQKVGTVTSGPGPDPTRPVARSEVRVVNEPKLSTWARFDRALPTRLNCVGCQWVAQWVYP